MSLLDIKTRQSYLKELGFYKGEIDGIEGHLTKKAYKKLQNKYFIRKRDRDGIYGTNTDILLRNAYICHQLKYFKLKEFKCTCKGKYCTGYPAVLDIDLLKAVDDTRGYYNTSISIESGLRCKMRNKEVGGSKTSKHMTGGALDLRKSKLMNTLEKRKSFIDRFELTYEVARYCYCNGYVNNNGKKSYKSYPNMGNNIHVGK